MPISMVLPVVSVNAKIGILYSYRDVVKYHVGVLLSELPHPLRLSKLGKASTNNQRYLRTKLPLF